MPNADGLRKSQTPFPCQIEQHSRVRRLTPDLYPDHAKPEGEGAETREPECKRTRYRVKTTVQLPLQPHHQTEVIQPTYTERWIRCPTSGCCTWQEATNQQLRTTVGMRKLWCKSCSSQSYSTKWDCRCGIRWHECEIHSCDPASHVANARTYRRKVCTKRVLHSYLSEAPVTVVNGQTVKRKHDGAG